MQHPNTSRIDWDRVFWRAELPDLRRHGAFVPERIRPVIQLADRGVLFRMPDVVPFMIFPGAGLGSARPPD